MTRAQKHKKAKIYKSIRRRRFYPVQGFALAKLIYALITCALIIFYAALCFTPSAAKK